MLMYARTNHYAGTDAPDSIHMHVILATLQVLPEPD